MPTVHHAYLGTAAATTSLPFFLENPQRYWWLALIIGAGLFMIADDVLYHVTNGQICFLCRIFPE